MEECTWDCDVSFGEFGTEITNSDCLRDCFEDTPCVGLLLDDPECSQQATIDALIEPSCIQSVFKQLPVVYGSIANVISSGSCFFTEADEEWFCFQTVEILANFETIQDCKDFWFPDYDYNGVSPAVLYIVCELCCILFSCQLAVLVLFVSFVEVQCF